MQQPPKKKRGEPRVIYGYAYGKVFWIELLMSTAVTV